MPLYEYKCHSCGKTFEVLQKFSDEPIRTHEACGGETERLISTTAFHLKGSGWYATDYAKGNGNTPKPGDAKAGDSKSGGTTSGDSTSGDSKSSNSKSSESGSDKKTSKELDSGPKSSSAESKPATSESKPAPAVSSDSR
jgi:putative FmdB family regulatory protein